MVQHPRGTLPALLVRRGHRNGFFHHRGLGGCAGEVPRGRHLNRKWQRRDETGSRRIRQWQQKTSVYRPPCAHWAYELPSSLSAPCGDLLERLDPPTCSLTVLTRALGIVDRDPLRRQTGPTIGAC